jgi:hypothetical protein
MCVKKQRQPNEALVLFFFDAEYYTSRRSNWQIKSSHTDKQVTEWDTRLRSALVSSMCVMNEWHKSWEVWCFFSWVLIYMCLIMLIATSRESTFSFWFYTRLELVLGLILALVPGPTASAADRCRWFLRFALILWAFGVDTLQTPSQTRWEGVAKFHNDWTSFNRILTFSFLVRAAENCELG